MAEFRQLNLSGRASSSTATAPWRLTASTSFASGIGHCHAADLLARDDYFLNLRRAVADLQAERALLEANRKLMELFEKKIQSKLAEVWGEEENSRQKSQEAQA